MGFYLDPIELPLAFYNTAQLANMKKFCKEDFFSDMVTKRKDQASLQLHSSSHCSAIRPKTVRWIERKHSWAFQATLDVIRGRADKPFAVYFQ